MRQPPEKSATALLLRFGRKAEAVQQAGGAGARGVAADLAQALVDGADALGVVLLLGDGEAPLQLAQLDVAVERELDGQVRQGRSFLRHGGDGEVLHHRDVALVGGELAEDGGEQGRFAGAVAADHAGAPAGVDGERRVFQQRARSAPQRGLGQGDHAVILTAAAADSNRNFAQRRQGAKKRKEKCLIQRTQRHQEHQKLS